MRTQKKLTAIPEKNNKTTNEQRTRQSDTNHDKRGYFKKRREGTAFERKRYTAVICANVNVDKHEIKIDEIYSASPNETSGIKTDLNWKL